jgi:hypothetical protein
MITVLGQIVINFNIDNPTVPIKNDQLQTQLHQN